jgi:hypothetical protein
MCRRRRQRRRRHLAAPGVEEGDRERLSRVDDVSVETTSTTLVPWCATASVEPRVDIFAVEEVRMMHLPDAFGSIVLAESPCHRRRSR